MFTQLMPLFLILVLTSCNAVPVTSISSSPLQEDLDRPPPSILRERFTYTVYEREHAIGEHPLPLVLAQPPTASKCSAFVIPEAPPLPKLPAIDYQRMNDEQVGELLVEHIIHMHDYIKERDRKIQDEYKQYTDRCTP